ncbi:uncharacterized protein LOC101207838 [Cucumis sativus]|uniref:N-acetyltransferase domain-containing protein n=1 Tax=Cucumis sativus TaxID=3659 RepID=A0A0A0LWN0_CUCSA|nr:uncharacterized protein LOC101207838 [Cucumis sativus]KGN66295.1 hypothetical protein Csa_007025 [Cucumis sativus]
MSAAISIYRPEFLGSVQDRCRNHLKFHRTSAFASWNMTMDYKSHQTMKKEEVSIQISTPLLLPKLKPLAWSGLQFDRPPPDDEDLIHLRKLEFGQFVAREAVIDEELWTAAWLRAESHWENRQNDRYVDSFKRKFAEQEFNAIKKRCGGQYGQTCTCIVTVRKEQKHIKRTVIKSVVATLDLCLRHLMHGETFPGEREKSHVCSINKEIPNKYAYISNLCVLKAARRQGIAGNMLKFAVLTAKSRGIEQVYVHVRRNNTPAQALYQKIGFEVVETASSQLVEEQTYLLCLNTEKLNNEH